MAIEIVDLPINNGGSFHSYVNVYQRVYFFLGGAMGETQHDQWVRWYAYNSIHINTWHPQIVFLYVYIYYITG